MKKRKTIIAAIVLFAIFLVGGAIAYFTDSDTKTNIFTIGNVDITLTEPLWSALPNADGNEMPDAAEDMMPGETVTKDPTINNVSEDNPAFVFAKVQVPCTTIVAPATESVELFTYSPNADWTELTTAKIACTDGGTATHVYYYGTNGTLTPLAKAVDDQTPTPTATPVFSSVTLRSSLTGNEGLTGAKQIIVTGYGIQTEGLASTAPADVWGNF